MAWSVGLKTEQNDQTGVFVSDIHNGDYIKVREVDFESSQPRSFTAAVASALSGGTLEVHLDSLGGQQIAALDVPHTGGGEIWRTLNVLLSNGNRAVGKHDLFFVFKGYKGAKLFNFDWWRFDR